MRSTVERAALRRARRPRAVFDAGRALPRRIRRLPRPDAFKHRADGGWRDVSSAEAQLAIERVAAALAARGIAARATASRSCPRTASSGRSPTSAILTAGAVTVPVYPTLTAAQARHILADSEAKLAFVSTRAAARQARRHRARAAGAPRRSSCFDAGAAGDGTTAWAALLDEGKRALARDPRLGARVSATRCSADDLATLIYTSGTTGPPKGVMLTAREPRLERARRAARLHDRARATRALSVLPLSHIFERMAGHFTMVARAVSDRLRRERRHVRAPNMQEIRPTIVFAVPRLFEKIYQRVLDAGARPPGPLKRGDLRSRARDARGAGRARRRRHASRRRSLALAHAIYDRLVYAQAARARRRAASASSSRAARRSRRDRASSSSARACPCSRATASPRPRP